MPTEFDWRVGVFDRQPLFVCRYFMAEGHWQIYHHGEKRTTEGECETIAVEHAPRDVLQLALQHGERDRRRFLRRRHQDGERPPSADGDQRQPERRSRRRGRDPRRRALRSDHERDSRSRRCRTSNSNPPPETAARAVCGLRRRARVHARRRRDARRGAGRRRAARGGRRRADRRVRRTATSPGTTSSRCTSSSSNATVRGRRSRAWAQRSRTNVALANDEARPRGPRLMPTAMHPWMDPNERAALAARHARRLRDVRPDLLAARATAGQTCKARSSTCRSPATRNSRGCTPRFASCCRFCRGSPRARRSSTASATGFSTTGSSSIAAIARGSRRLRATWSRNPSARSASTTSAARADLSRPRAARPGRRAAATNGSTRAGRSRASSGWHRDSRARRAGDAA